MDQKGGVSLSDMSFLGLEIKLLTFVKVLSLQTMRWLRNRNTCVKSCCFVGLGSISCSFRQRGAPRWRSVADGHHFSSGFDVTFVLFCKIS